MCISFVMIMTCILKYYLQAAYAFSLGMIGLCKVFSRNYTFMIMEKVLFIDLFIRHIYLEAI